jgi:hypothetical protein
MLTLRLQEIEKIDEAEASPCPYPSDMMLQCETQGSAKPAGFYNRLRKCDGKRTCGAAAI